MSLLVRARVVAVAASLLLVAHASISSVGLAEPLLQEQPADEVQAPEEQPQATPDDAPWWTWRNTPEPIEALTASLAYQMFWQARTEALGEPDADGELNLGNVMSGNALSRELDALHKLERAGQALVVRADRHPQIAYADGQQIVIVDRYLNSSYLVDARTRAPLSDPNTAPVTTSISYLLAKTLDSAANNGLGDVWKVVDSVQLADP